MSNPILPLPFIDYSQHSTFLKCPGMWIEKYINHREKRWMNEGQRDDALAIGSMVHAGLQQWQETSTLGIPMETLEEIGPSPEAVRQVCEMLEGYRSHYPQELWPIQKCEAPLRFPLPEMNGEVEGLAKVDHFFHNPFAIDLNWGPEDETITLSEGWWIQEYKTKSPDIPRDLWIRGWLTNLQASYQTLALQHKLKVDGWNGKVEGVMVTVIEKPKSHIPKRKCKLCGVQYEFGLWIPKGSNYLCPVCNNEQALQKLKDDPVYHPPSYFRILVTRSAEQLQHHQLQIETVAQRMQDLRGWIPSNGLIPWDVQLNWERCVDTSRRGAAGVCQYHSNHLNYNSTLEDTEMVPTRDYVKEPIHVEIDGGNDE